MRLFPITFWASSTQPSTGFDYFRRGSPLGVFVGTGVRSFDYFRRGSPLRGLR